MLHEHSNREPEVLHFSMFAGVVDEYRTHRIHGQLNIEHKQGRYLLGIWQGLCSWPKMWRRWQLDMPRNVIDLEVE